jgi:hypothetical protein
MPEADPIVVENLPKIIHPGTNYGTIGDTCFINRPVVVTSPSLRPPDAYGSLP